MNTLDTLGLLSEMARDVGERVPSPCVSVCRMDPGSGLCEGCFRTIDEIVAWSRMDEPGKTVVWDRIRHRAGLGVQQDAPQTGMLR